MTNEYFPNSFEVEKQTLPPVMNRISNTSFQRAILFPTNILVDAANTKDPNFNNVSLFVNPIADDIQNIIISLNNLSKESNTVTRVANIVGNTSLAEIANVQMFLNHTNRISGKIRPGTDEPEDLNRMVPYLSVLVPIGRTLSYIKYVEQDVVDYSYTDNCFTALSNSTSQISTMISLFDGYKQEINTSYSTVYDEFMNPIVVSNLTTERLNEMSANIVSKVSILNVDRKNDEQSFSDLLDEMRNSTPNFIGIIAQVQKDMINNAFNNLT